MMPEMDGSVVAALQENPAWRTFLSSSYRARVTAEDRQRLNRGVGTSCQKRLDAGGPRARIGALVKRSEQSQTGKQDALIVPKILYVEDNDDNLTC